MRNSISLIILFALLSSQVASQDRVSAYKPTPKPDRIILTIEGNPASTMAVTWRTDTMVNETVAQLSPDLPTVFLEDSSITVTGTFEDVAGDGVVGRFHSVNFSSLMPGTTYAYRVGSGTLASEWFTFTTASSSPGPFTFLYLGDSQMSSNSLFARVIRKAYRSVPDARFMIFSGDLVDGGSGSRLQDDEWGDWYAAGGFIMAEIPVLPTPGNHEYYNPADRSKRELNKYWRPGFTLPENGPDGLKETAYSIDYEGVRVIFVNSDEMMRSAESAAKQALWVEGLLKENPCTWTVMVFHHPLFSTSAMRDNKAVREPLKQLIDRYGVDLVLSGHDHTYARGSVMPEGIDKKGNKAGTIYVVSVSGPKQYQQDAEPWWDIGVTNTQTWQAITVDGKELVYKAFDATGAIVDQFTLRKKKTGNTIRSAAR